MSDFYKMNDNELRDKLTNHEFAKMPGAWEQMEKMLQAEPATAIKSGTLYWWSLPLAAAAMFSGIITVGIYLDNNKNNAVVEDFHNKVNEANQTLVIGDKGSLADKNESVAALAFPKKDHISTKTIPEIKGKAKQATATSTKTVNKKVLSASAPKTTRKKTVVTQKVTSTATTEQPPVTINENSARLAAVNTATEEALPTTNEGTTRFPVKKTRTIVRYQYSSTPLKALMKRKNGLKTTNSKISAFGISNDNYKNKSPLKVDAYAGISTKILGSTQKVSVMPTGGVSVGYKITPKHAIQTGIQYKPIGLNGIGDASKEELGYRAYNDGNAVTKAYSIDRLDMLELPLTYEYTPHPKFSVQAGVKGSWIFNKEASNHPALSKMKNNDLGIVNFDIGMLLGIEVFLHKNLSIGLQYSMGFMNLMQDANNRHEEMKANNIAHRERAEHLTDNGECLVPIQSATDEMIRLPKDLRNNDVQLLVKYSF